jgi:hypothetical protein
MILTKSDYIIADLNGIPKKTVQTRVYTNGWDVDRAITQPVQQQTGIWTAWKDKMIVSRSVFYKRLKEGMSPEDAAMTPPTPYHERNQRKALLGHKEFERAAENGIAKITVKNRVYVLNWSVEKAVTTPVNVKQRRKNYEDTRS